MDDNAVVPDENIEIDDTAAEINWVNADDDLITVEDPTDTQDIPIGDYSEIPDVGYRENRGLESPEPIDEVPENQVIIDDASTILAQDQPQIAEELPATGEQINEDTSNAPSSSGSGLRGGMEQIATTESGLGFMMETKPENPERVFFNGPIESDDGGSHNPEMMG